MSKAKVFAASIGVALLTSMVVASPAAAAEDNFPSKPIRLIIPYAPGGSSDPVGRLVASKLEKVLGQPIVIENRGGAGGTIGTAEVARAKPDGYTLAAGTASTHVTGPLSRKTTPYDPTEDFELITIYGVNPMTVTVSGKLPVKTLKELVDLAKAQPGKLSYGHTGVGGLNNVAGELLNQKAGIDILGIPYQGTGASVIDTLSGKVPVIMATLSSAIMEHHKSGALRILAVLDDKRSSMIPDVPTAAEAGVPGVIISNWYFLAAPKGTPKPVVDKLYEGLKTIMADPDFKDKMENSLIFGVPDKAIPPAEFEEFVKEQLKVLKPVVETAGVKVE
jgi:tripartite-type tricarboxylate transporter receptor subunit TctC